MIRRIALPLLALAALWAAPEPARAWGFEGHRIVCEIAWQRLTPEARAMVGELLRAPGAAPTFAESCTWPDEVRPDRPETAAFHYINIPPGVRGADLERDCGDPAKRCNPWAIMHFTGVLADPAGSLLERGEALRFVGHFVGDLHQPLHAGRPEDLGGNRVAVDFFGRTLYREDRPLNLHGVWDSAILERAGLAWPDAGRSLAAQVDEDEAREWETLDVMAWTDESYRLCEDFVYGRLPAGGRIRDRYYRPALGHAEAQLQKAGVRLAYLLNRVAAGEPAFGADT